MSDITASASIFPSAVQRSPVFISGFVSPIPSSIGISIFVVGNDQKAKQVMVTTGIGAGDQIEVSGDLADGDTVIIRGNERLRPGQPVSIMEG